MSADHESQGKTKLAKRSSQLAQCKPPLSDTKKDEDYDDQSRPEFKATNYSQSKPNNNNLANTSAPHSTSSLNNGMDSSNKQGNSVALIKHGRFFNVHQPKALSRISFIKEHSFNSYITPHR